MESTDHNSCSVEVFDNIEQARDYAKREIHAYAEDYDGEVTDEHTNYFAMQSDDQYVTIEIIEYVIASYKKPTYRIWLTPNEGNSFWHSAYFFKEENAEKAKSALVNSGYYKSVEIRLF